MNNNERKLAIFDLDGTLVTSHLWLGIVKHHLKTKENLFSVFWYLFSHVALAPFWKMKLIPTEKYYKSWGQDLALTMKGIKTDRAKAIFEWLVDQYLLPSSKKNVLEKLKKHQEEGFLTILTSGSFQELVKIIANRLDIDFAIGTELEKKSDEFSGKIVPPFCFGQGKAEKVKNFLSEKNLKINFKESFVYSDSFFDLPILEMAGNPVVVEPDKKLLEIAKNKGWQII
jgi:HAD superfamily hydrolase (TIGR01490 family)